MGGYFKSKNKKDRIEQLEEAAGISTPKESQPSQGGFVAPSYTGPKPWKGEKPFKPIGPGLHRLTTIMDDETLLKRSTKGSKPFSKGELKQGYRKVG